MDKDKKLIVDNLTVSFRTTQGFVRAVRGISFELTEGETLAIVGESGSGKSVSSKAIMGILEGNATIDKGSIIYENQDLTKIAEESFHKIRGNKIGMIFQDPMSSLNPIMKIGKQLTEGIILNGKRLKNRYKGIIHQPLMEIANAKQQRRNLIKRYKREKEELKTEESAQHLKLKNELTVKLKDNKVKEKRQALKEEYKKKNTEIEHVDNSKKLADLKVQLKKEIVAVKTRINKARIDLIKSRPAAKKQVKLEWKAEKARINSEIKAIKEKGRGADSSRKEENYQQISDLKEQLRRFRKVTKKEAQERAIKVMEEVGIPEPVKRLKQYPFQFSGGMRQRIVIAIALTANPDLLICDEPTTALDVTIQAQILDLIKNLKTLRSLSVIFITHDLGVVAHMADRVAVMYAGKIVEIGKAEEIFYNPKHPYTWALLSSMPDINSKARLTSIPGTPPNMLFPPKGDAFAERSSYAMKIDFEEEPPYFKVSDTHYAASWLLHKNAPKVEMPKIIGERIEEMQQTTEEVKN